MGTPFPQRSLAGGELAPALHSRVDLTKYQTGLKKQRNCTTSKSGGVKNRAGFRFIAEIKDSTYEPKLIPFVPNENQSYVLLMENFNMRVIKDNDYIYDEAVSISAVTASGSANVSVTATGHGYATGDEVWIEGVSGIANMNNRQFLVVRTNANAFTLTEMDGTNTYAITGTYVSGGLSYRVMDVTSPFASEDVQEVQYVQDGISLVMVHGNYKPQKLTMVSETEWSFAELDLEDLIDAPTVTNSGTSPGTGATSWVVTTIEKDTIEESLASTATTCTDVPTTAAPITLTITHVTNADSFCVYKKTNGVYGWIGDAKATGSSVTFIDNGITPDISEQPPTSRDLSEAFEDFNKCKDPSDVPGDLCRCAKWNPAGTILAVGSDDDTGETARRLFLYSRTGNTLTKITNPATMPTGIVYGVDWSLDGKYMAVAHATTPYITVYSVSGTTFTKVADPADLPDGTAMCCAFTPTGRGLFVGTGTSPYYHWYGFDGTTLTEYASQFSLGSIPGAQINCVSFNPILYENGTSVLTEMAIGLNGVSTSPELEQYASNYSAYANPKTGEASFGDGYGFTYSYGAVHGIEWSKNGRFLALAHSTTPFVSVYAKAAYTGVTEYTLGYALTAMTNPATLPTGTGDAVSWNPTSDMLAVGHDTTPFLTCYNVQGWAQPKLVVTDFPTTAPPGASYGVSFHPTGLYLSTANASANYMANYEVLLNSPSVVTTYQQRLLLMNSNEKPLGTWGSRTGLPYNFTMSTPIRDDDSLSYNLFSKRPASIVGAADVGRLVTLTTSTEYSVKGGDDGVLRPGEVNPRAHSYNGAARIEPVVIDNSMVYVHRSKKSLHDFVYDVETDGYRGDDLTIFATHLFLKYTVDRMAFQKTPDSILWVVRSDGTLLGLTYVKEHEIMAWFTNDTDGDFEDVCVVPDGGEDALYVVVKRTINSVDVRYVERLQSRVIDDIVDLKLLDSCLTYDGRNTATTTMTLSGGTGWDNNETITCTASAATFTVTTDIGNEVHITYGGEVYRLEITATASTTSVTVRPQRDIPAGLQGVATDDWSLAKNTVSGIWHLEGETVSVFADGFVTDRETVSSGSITLDRCYAVIHVGLRYVSDIQLLDIDTTGEETLAGRKKLFNRVILRINESRGIWIGAGEPVTDGTTTDLEELKIRENETMDDPVTLYTGEFSTTAPGTFTDGGSVFIRQVDPVPMEILSVCPEVEVGGK